MEQTAENTEIEDYRAELIRLSNAGEITQSEKYLRKASDKVIMKVQKDYIVAQREKANTVLTEALIDKFSDLMEAINMVDSGEALKAELNQDKLFRSDVKSVVGKLSPYIPYLGIVSGGVTTVKHVYGKLPNRNQRATQMTKHKNFPESAECGKIAISKFFFG
jgi:hypothetical protein